MSTVLCFAVFLAAMVVCVILGWSGIWALWLGVLLFAVLGLRRGLTVKELWRFAWSEGKKLMPLLVFFLLIGCTTGLWRSSGTIAWMRPFCFTINEKLRVLESNLQQEEYFCQASVCLNHAESDSSAKASHSRALLSFRHSISIFSINYLSNFLRHSATILAISAGSVACRCKPGR